MKQVIKTRCKLILALCVLVVFLGIYYTQNYLILKQPTLQQQLKALLKECKNDPGCFKKKLNLQRENINLGEVMIFLEQEVGPTACHELAHAAAEIAGELTKDISKNISTCNEKCGFGCYHGVFLGALRVNPSLMDILDSVCKPFANLNYPGQQLTACHHGLGHGLAELAKFDLVQATLFCDQLRERRSQDECATGVFMEIIEGSILGNGRTQLQIPENIDDLCQPLSQNYKDICLLNTGSYEYKRSKDIVKSFGICKSLPANLQNSCAQDMGTDLYFILRDPDKIWQACAQSDGNQVPLCIKGAIFSGLVADPSGKAGDTLCRKIPESLQSDCFKYLNESLMGINKANG